MEHGKTEAGPRWRALKHGLTMLALLTWAARAAADVVPPPPKKCPPGTVAVTSHSGPACKKEAPKNCPVGYRGVLGGICRLDTCASDLQCEREGKVCRDYSLCYEERTRYYAKKGERAEGWRGLLGMGPRRRLDPPQKYWHPIDICSPGKNCPAPKECRPGKLCVPPATPMPVLPSAQPPDSGSPPAPADAAAAPTPTTTESPAPPAAAPSAVAPPDSGRVDERPTGCGSGCAGTPASQLPWAGLLALGALGLAAMRKRSRR